MRVLPKGTEVTCPTCGRVMVRLKKEIESGGRLKAADFEPVLDTPAAGQPANCPYDKTPYIATKVHTAEGWT